MHKLLVEFPGRPVAKTPHFHCRGHEFSPWSGNGDPVNCVCGTAKKLKNNEYAFNDSGCLYNCLIFFCQNLSDIVQTIKFRSSEHELLIRKQLHGVVGARRLIRHGYFSATRESVSHLFSDKPLV